MTEAQDGKVKVHLRQCMNYKRHQEIDDGLVNHLQTLSKEQLKEAIKELGGQKRYVRGSKGNQLAIPVILQTEDMVKQFTATGLIDSGCTGSCIDVDLIRQHNIPTKKLKVPLPVYNADGSLNSMGRITDYVDMRMTILDHSERISLAVTKIGNPELFIGLDWLRNHNPSIDWVEAKISFDRCPDAWGYTADLEEIESDESDEMEPQIQLNKDKKLYVMDWDAYVNKVSTKDKSMEMVNKYI